MPGLASPCSLVSRSCRHYATTLLLWGPNRPCPTVSPSSSSSLPHIKRPVTQFGRPGERVSAAAVWLLFHQQSLGVDLSGADAHARALEMQALLSRLLKDNTLDSDGKQAAGVHRPALVSDLDRLVARVRRVLVQGVGAKLSSTLLALSSDVAVLRSPIPPRRPLWIHFSGRFSTF